VRISVQEYLSTSYRPDCELIDGQLVERNVGEFDHSNLHGAAAAWLRIRAREWNVRVLIAQRIRISATRYRVPDISVFTRSADRAGLHECSTGLH
jgi:Uma2 family endonuclease